MTPRTLIIIPAFNEEQALPGVVAELRHHTEGADILVVDDGSTDNTSQVGRDVGVTVACLPFNLGTGGALRTGFRYAVGHGYTRAIQFDADGQHDPAEIANLVAALDRGTDLVVGSRFRSQSNYPAGRLRSRGMRHLALALRLLSGRTFTDTSSGFRGFSRPMIDFFAHSYPVEYLSDTVEALLLACYAGFRVDEVPVVMRLRNSGQPSTRNLKLLYHYVRVVIVLLSSASRRGRMEQVAP